MISHTNTQTHTPLDIPSAGCYWCPLLSCRQTANGKRQRQRRLLLCQFFTLVHKYLLQLNFAGNRNAICTINSRQHLPATPLWHSQPHSHTHKPWNLKNEVRLEHFCVFIKIPTGKLNIYIYLYIMSLY